MAWHRSGNSSRSCAGIAPAKRNEIKNQTKQRKTMTTKTANNQDTILNGVNATKLGQIIEAVKQQPELAQFQFRARNKWDDGTHNVATVDSFFGTGQELKHAQQFQLHADEPAVLLGKDQGVNPVEFVLGGLSACMTSSLVYHAAG